MLNNSKITRKYCWSINISLCTWNFSIILFFTTRNPSARRHIWCLMGANDWKRKIVRKMWVKFRLKIEKNHTTTITFFFWKLCLSIKECFIVFIWREKLLQGFSQMPMLRMRRLSLYWWRFPHNQITSLSWNTHHRRANIFWRKTSLQYGNWKIFLQNDYKLANLCAWHVMAFEFSLSST